MSKKRIGIAVMALGMFLWAAAAYASPEAPRLRSSIADSFDIVMAKGVPVLEINPRNVAALADRASEDAAIAEFPLTRPRPTIGGVKVASLGNGAMTDIGPRRASAEPVHSGELTRTTMGVTNVSAPICAPLRPMDCQKSTMYG